MDDLPESPKCPACMTTLEVAGTVEHPFWVCPSCRVAVIAS